MRCSQLHSDAIAGASCSDPMYGSGQPLSPTLLLAPWQGPMHSRTRQIVPAATPLWNSGQAVKSA